MRMFTIHVLNFNKFNTTIIPTSDSWLLHITKLCNLKCIVKNSEQVHNSSHHNMILQKIHTKDVYRIHYRSLCFFVLLKT